MLRSSLSGDVPSRATPPRESPIADKGNRPMEEDIPSEASSPGEVEAAPMAGASSRVRALLSSREDSTEVPRSPPARTGPARDPLEDFEVPPAGAPFGAGSSAPSGGFPWMPELGPMLDELWSEEIFRQLSEEPLQAENREGMRLLAKVNPVYIHIPFLFRLATNLNFCRHFLRTSPIPGGRRQSTPMDGMLCSRLEARRRSSRPSSTGFRLSFANSGLNLNCPSA